jgi:hypothetical protein
MKKREKNICIFVSLKKVSLIKLQQRGKTASLFLGANFGANVNAGIKPDLYIGVSI